MTTFQDPLKYPPSPLPEFIDTKWDLSEGQKSLELLVSLAVSPSSKPRKAPRRQPSSSQKERQLVCVCRAT